MSMTAEHPGHPRAGATASATSRSAASPPGSRCGPGSAPTPTTPPLLLCNGIGVSLEALQPLVDELHPDRGLVRFDVPGIGGSALPPFPYPIAGLASWVDRADGQAGSPPLRRPRPVLGRRARAAAGGAVAAAGTPGGAGRDRHRHADGAGPPARAEDHVHAATPPRPGVRGAGGAGDLRRLDAHRPRPRGRAAARRDPVGPQARLLLPAGRHGRLDEPAVPAPAAAADAGDGRRRRPDHPGGQPEDAGRADPPLAAARLPRRTPRHPDRGRRARPVIDSSRSTARAWTRRTPHERPGRPRPRGLPLLRLPRLRAAARRRGPRAAQPGARVHDARGRAGHQRLLDPRGVPARAGPGHREARHRRPGLRRTGLSRPRRPGRRHGRDGARPGRPVDRHVHGRARRPGDGLDPPLRLRRAARALAAGDGPDGADRRVRPDRARHRLGHLRRARDAAPGATATSGSSTARRSGSATPRSPTSSSSGPATRRTSRSRDSSSRRAPTG